MKPTRAGIGAGGGLASVSTTPGKAEPMTESITAGFVKGQTYYVEAKGFGTSTGTSGVSSNYALRVMVNPTVDALAPTPTASAAARNFAKSIMRG